MGDTLCPFPYYQPTKSPSKRIPQLHYTFTNIYQLLIITPTQLLTHHHPTKERSTTPPHEYHPANPQHQPPNRLQELLHQPRHLQPTQLLPYQNRVEHGFADKRHIEPQIHGRIHRRQGAEPHNGSGTQDGQAKHHSVEQGSQRKPPII